MTFKGRITEGRQEDKTENGQMDEIKSAPADKKRRKGYETKNKVKNFLPAPVQWKTCGFGFVSPCEQNDILKMKQSH